MKDADIQTTYDQVPYESHSFPESHPDRLATMGKLFGLSPAPVTGCRVLELGCCSGGNLIPMAYHLPDSQFVGVDSSKRQVDRGRRTIEALSLKNIRMEHTSILDVDDSWGTFDYIVTHGVYSWVPDDVQEKILSVSSNNLKPHGVAYISYNTYPGWHMREMIRHMMLFHASRFPEPEQRIQQARALLNFLAGSVPTEGNYYGALLKAELETVLKSRDDLLFHEHLEEVNSPIYFYQFVDRASKHGLQYLSEADLAAMSTSGFPQAAMTTLQRISPDVVSTEQYMDFLRKRVFRQTLLCHRNLKVERKLGTAIVSGLLVASPAKSDTQPLDPTADEDVTFRTPQGARYTTRVPLIKAALTVLREYWPRAVELARLLEMARERLGGTKAGLEVDAEKDREVLGGSLLHGCSVRLVEFHTWQPDYTTEATERPKACELAACQVHHGIPIANRRHETVELNFFARQLLPMLDGTRDRARLMEGLQALVNDGTMVLHQSQETTPVKDSELVRDALGKGLDQALDSLSTAALLVG